MENSIIADWQPHHAEAYGKQNLLLHHRLADSGLFTKSVLADLIDKCPASNYTLNTMGYDPENPEWRQGVVRDVSGEEVIASIETGRMWLNMRSIEEFDPRYKRLLNQMFKEFSSNIPGFDTFKRKMGILISSPLVQVLYHCDIPGQSLWQLEGEKRVYVYPTGKPYMDQRALETIILKETDEEIPYNRSMDEGASVYVLKPGETINWPLNSPHRVENLDCLNISVTTEHYTKDIRKNFAVNYANGILRRKFKMENLSQSITGPMVYPKAALAFIWRELGFHKSKQVKHTVDFALDPNSENGMVDIPAYEL